MPQGTVVAIKPIGFTSEAQLMNYSSTETANYSARSAEEPLTTANLIYIKVYEDEVQSSHSRRADSVVWYQDSEGRFDVGDLVEFNINRRETKPIQAAENVRKIKSGKTIMRGGLLQAVALFASSLLIFAVILDRKRH